MLQVTISSSLWTYSAPWLGGGLCDLRRIEFLSQGRFGGGEIRVDFLGLGLLGLDLARVVHGPPSVVLKPVSRAEVIEIDDPLTNRLALRIEGFDRHEQIIRLLVLGVHRRSLLNDGLLDLLFHVFSHE